MVTACTFWVLLKFVMISINQRKRFAVIWEGNDSLEFTMQFKRSFVNYLVDGREDTGVNKKVALVRIYRKNHWEKS